MKNFLCTAALLALTLSAHAQSLVAVDLGTLGGPTSGATAINNATRITGQADTPPALGGTARAFSWTLAGMVNLGSLGGSFSVSTAISSATTINPERIVGFSTIAGETSTHAFLVNGTSLLDLHLRGSQNSFARAVQTGRDNRFRLASFVAGSHINSQGVERALLWTVVGTGISAADLGTLGGSSSAAFGMSPFGNIVGTAALAGNRQSHPFLRRPGSTALQDLGTLGGPNGVAFAVNDNFDVVGEADTAGGVRHAFRWLPAIEQFPPADLGTLGGKNSSARAINSSQIIVGTAQNSRGESRAVKWLANNQIVDLNTLIAPESGWVLQVATGINNSGEIVGQGLLNGKPRAFLLTFAIP